MPRIPARDFLPQAGTLARLRVPAGRQRAARRDRLARGRCGRRPLRSRCWRSSSPGARTARRRSTVSPRRWPRPASPASSATAISWRACCVIRISPPAISIPASSRAIATACWRGARPPSPPSPPRPSRSSPIEAAAAKRHRRSPFALAPARWLAPRAARAADGAVPRRGYAAHRPRRSRPDRDRGPDRRRLDWPTSEIELDGERFAATVLLQPGLVTIVLADETCRLALVDPLAPPAEAQAGAARLTAPMPGKVLAVHVAPGARVERGQLLMVLEAMKMEHAITAPAEGVVETVSFRGGRSRHGRRAASRLRRRRTELKAMRLPSHVRMVEVGPRDGLQNEARAVPAAVKIALIERLADAGLAHHRGRELRLAQGVPQMADTAAVMAGITRRPGVSYPVLVPNMKGYAAARAAGASEVAIFAAATESFSRRNINCSIAESIARFAPVAEAARRDGVKRARLCVLRHRLPLRGRRSRRRRSPMSRRSLLALGCYEISLGDTIGTGTPARVEAMIDAVAARSAAGAARRAFPRHLRPGGRQHRWPRWARGSPSSTVRSRGSAAVPSRRAPPAMSRARTCSICSTGSASRPASISAGSRRPAASSPQALGREPASKAARALAAQGGMIMALHLLKLAVGVGDLAELRKVQRERRRRARPLLLLHAQHAAPRGRDPRWRLDLLGDQGLCAGAPAHPRLRADRQSPRPAGGAGEARGEDRADRLASRAAPSRAGAISTQGRAGRSAERRSAARRLPPAMARELRELGLL